MENRRRSDQTVASRAALRSPMSSFIVSPFFNVQLFVSFDSAAA